MQSIGEGEQVEFDGIRRRKTIVGDPNRPPTRRSTVVQKVQHPPLGMTHFPNYESDEDDNSSFHPGFFQRLRSRGKSTSSRGSSHRVGSTPMKSLPPIPTDGASDISREGEAYKQVMQEDTSYKPGDTHIHFAELPQPPYSSERNASSDPALQAPKPPPHIAKRQFSFQNVFGRNRSDSTGESSKRPASRHSRKTSKDGKAVATEEERLGLVKGDSSNLLPIASHDSREQEVTRYTDEQDWTPDRTASPGSYAPIRVPPPPRRVETPEIDPRDTRDPSDYEKQGARGGFQ